jgi:hypothetical protein
VPSADLSQRDAATKKKDSRLHLSHLCSTVRNIGGAKISMRAVTGWLNPKSHIHTHTHTHNTCLHTCTHTHTRTHAHAHAHTHARAHTHTHTHASSTKVATRDRTLHQFEVPRSVAHEL